MPGFEPQAAQLTDRHLAGRTAHANYPLRGESALKGSVLKFGQAVARELGSHFKV